MQCNAALCRAVKAESSRSESISHVILALTEHLALQLPQLKLVHLYGTTVCCVDTVWLIQS